jgi:hypothetical protein
MSYLRTPEHKALMSKRVKEAFKKEGFSASEITKRGWKNLEQDY